MASVQSLFRLVHNNQPVFSQPDFFVNPASIDRAVGLVPDDLEARVFHDNEPLDWSLVDGSEVSTSQISSGRLYFSPIIGADGFYGLRFRPNALGLWRVV